MSKYSELKRLAEAATPQNFDSAEEKAENGYIECPHCGGQGEVEREADYCNYDNTAIGVQFYGIGNEFGAAEAYYRAANPAAVMALIADFDAEHALRLAGDHQVEQLREQLAEVIAALENSHTALAALACLAPQHRTEVIDQAIDQAAFTLSHAKAHPINSDHRGRINE